MKTVYTKFNHGKYSFALSVEFITDKILKENLLKALNTQFKDFNLSDKNAAIEFYFVENIDKFFPKGHYLNIGPIRYSDNILRYIDHEISFVYTKGNIHKVYIEINKNNSLKANLKFLNKGFFNYLERQMSTFYYRIFLPLTQYVNIEYGSTYIHGASISDKDGNAVLFPADSGVGKSSMLFKIAQEGKYFYIADDLSIIDENNNTYYSGRAISVKPYHLKNFPYLTQKINQDMPKGQQLQWRILQDNRLVFGMNPKSLFSNKIKKEAKIKKIVHLINTNDKDFQLKNIDNDMLAFTSANILMKELFLGLHNINKSLSIPGNKLFMPPCEMYNIILNIYKKVFSNSEQYLLHVPYKSHPEKMYEFLKKNNILN